MILDVGCGHRFSGDVNLDLFIEATHHRSLNQRKVDDKPLDVKSIPNFVKGTAEDLPFRSRVFDEVVCFHTLEHIPNVGKALRELVRVSGEVVRIVVPHRLGDNWLVKKVHVNHFGAGWFQNLERLGLKVKVELKYEGFPFRMIGLFMMPKEIHVEIRRAEFTPT